MTDPAQSVNESRFTWSRSNVGRWFKGKEVCLVQLSSRRWAARVALVAGAACRSLRARFGTEFPQVVRVTAMSTSYEDYVSFWVGASHVHALGELGIMALTICIT